MRHSEYKPNPGGPPKAALFKLRFCESMACAAIIATAIFLQGGCNPFAPAVDFGEDGGSELISDQSTVDGVFRNFRSAYTFKDTTIFGGLLSHDFTFTYRDYDKLVDVSWGRDEEMRITSRLFDNAQNLNLIWNNIIGFAGDSLRSNVTRGFNLTVTFNPADIVRVDGRVTLDLRRPSSDAPWKIALWKDESNF